MPIYEYVCPTCGHPFEKRVSFADADALQPCPSCGYERALKQISLVAAHHATTSSLSRAGAAPACGPVG